MNKVIMLCMALTLALFANSQQETGIRFDHEHNWSQILAQAKKENKLIFVDAFTTWCGPCRFMSKNIFPLKEVGDFYNEHFIMVKAQLDTSKSDNDYVKAHYADFAAIGTTYKVRAYPTYLIINGDGQLVHKFLGSMPAPEFLAKGKDAINPDKQLYAMLDKFNKGERDPQFLLDLTRISEAAYEPALQARAFDAWTSTQTDLLSEKNIPILFEFTNSSQDKGFPLLQANAARVDAVVGAGKTAQKMKEIAIQETIAPAIARTGNTSPDFDAIHTSLVKQYPAQADELTAYAKVAYAQQTQNWPAFQTNIVAYMAKYCNNCNPAELNEYAWTVFENCKDKDCLEKALAWSQMSFEKNQEPGMMDTYANLLYKLGRTNEAIRVEEKALALADEGDKKGYQEVIDKMKKGEKTWKE